VSLDSPPPDANHKLSDLLSHMLPNDSIMARNAHVAHSANELHEVRTKCFENWINSY